MNHEPHLPDDRLLQSLDGELDPADRAGVERHLAACSSCRERREEFRSAMNDFARIHLDRELPLAGTGAARLRAALSRESGRDRRLPGDYGVAATCTAALLLVASIWMVAHSQPTAYLPDARLTPGATRSASRDQLCGGLVNEGDPISDETALRVFAEYRIRQPRAGAYEVDYLITPALGGSNDIRNLWPQPYSGGDWNARVKDALEDYLRDQVCRGAMDLATAQSEIASDWVAAYRKHFRTDRPLAAHAMFVKDEPWKGFRDR